MGLAYVVAQLAHEAKSVHTVSGGLALADMDNDGDLDLYVAHGRNAKGKLFDQRNGRFVALGGNNGIAPEDMDRAGYFVDLDSDGWRDFVSVQNRSVQVFRNEGDGFFVEHTEATNLRHSRSTFSMAAADFDLDGDLDLFFAHWQGSWNPSHRRSEYLWRNDGTGFFEDISDRVAVHEGSLEGRPDVALEHSFTPTFADIDADGYPDLLLASDFGTSQVFRNERGGAFTDITTEVISDENGMGSAVGDYDNDGDLDWFVSSVHAMGSNDFGSDTGNRMYRNDGQGNFEDATDSALVRNGDWGWGSCLQDFDNDGHLDLFHTNGIQDYGERYLEDTSRLFMSNGDGTFTERAESSGISHTGQGRGVVCADYNDDGQVDIFIANNGNAPNVYENNTDNRNHYLAVDLEGTPENADAIGARITVTSASGQQIREVRLGTWYLSQGPATAHFGLGVDDRVSELEIAWPGPDRLTSRLVNVAVDQRLRVRHP